MCLNFIRKFNNNKLNKIEINDKNYSNFNKKMNSSILNINEYLFDIEIL